MLTRELVHNIKNPNVNGNVIIKLDMTKALAELIGFSYVMKKKHHWIAWKKLCYPTDEGGIGIKSIQDINNIFSAKVWWSFRTRNTLWRNFLEAKYCPRAHPVKKKWVSGQSHTWKRILHVRSDCEKYRNLGQHFPNTRRPKKLKVANFMIGNTWDENKLLRILPMDMVKQIQNINIYEGEDDFPIWTPDTHGFFTCKPLGKLLKNKLALDQALHRFCVADHLDVLVVRTMLRKTQTIFLKWRTCDEVWNYFNIHSDIFDNHNNIRSTLMKLVVIDHEKQSSFFCSTMHTYCHMLGECGRLDHDYRYEGIKCNPPSYLGMAAVEVLKPRLDIDASDGLNQ
ncbi:hypothetical protein H5410_006698 [Solanum commersonii]|uniref:Uncharacterized protein n=1 Tax=Solanum commersonii TaxID=4109 RepID=A0A9J6AAI5_SOLCO|nr:hypothetical protein H5410_006698 [Solanum commersonii]